jgi:hypothetical protein
MAAVAKRAWLTPHGRSRLRRHVAWDEVRAQANRNVFMAAKEPISVRSESRRHISFTGLLIGAFKRTQFVGRSERLSWSHFCL